MTKIFKKYLNAVGCVLAAPCLTFSAVACSKTQKMADKVIYGSKVYTMDSNDTEAEAVAIRNGRILAVGSKQDMVKYIDASTEIVDYDGKYIFPGFIDSHAHGEELGCYLTKEAPLTSSMSYEQCANVMKAWVASRPGEELYIGNGWQYQHDSLMHIVEPTWHDLDYPELNNKGLMLLSEELHKVWVNKYVLDKYKDEIQVWKQKYGTDLVKVDENGEPTGVFCDTAMVAMCTPLPITTEDIKVAVEEWQRFALSQGYTTVNEGAIFWEGSWVGTPRVYHDLDLDNKLKLRTFAAMYILDQVCDTPMQLTDYEYEAIKATQMNTKNFKVNAVKIFVDGVVESRTGLLIDPYEDSGDEPYYGINRYGKFGDEQKQIETLSLLTSIANQRGLAAHFHCIGDRAVRLAAKACALSQSQTHIPNMGNTILHCQLVDEESKELMAKYHIHAALSPLWFPINDDYKGLEINYLGWDREYNESYPFKSLLDKGVPVVFCSDIPAGSISMAIGHTLYRGITRANPHDTDPQKHRRGTKTNPNYEGFDENDPQVRKQMIRCFTTESAKMLRADSTIGSIEVGKYADFSVFDVDFINCPIKDVADPNPDYHAFATIVNGIEQYNRDHPNNRTTR